ncbi:hypothetical protein UVI_02059790 [Ustilaginoidea virens]|uniref:Uncharacterized protein n=1 Tax=Ustilaginoidea virens TaxID=1159556 RepID=A0A1B5L4M9_USTVR|nr:hypothetical protein UVI_02059790 [Ustilaginoidea virens]
MGWETGGQEYGPWQAYASQQLAHPPFHFDILPQGVGLGRADDAGIAHLRQQLGHHVVVVLNLGREQRGADEVLKGIDDAVQELEDEERLDFRGRGREEQEVGVGQAEDEGRRAGVGEMDQMRSGSRVLEVEGQEVRRGERPARVGMRQDGVPGSAVSRWAPGSICSNHLPMCASTQSGATDLLSSYT